MHFQPTSTILMALLASAYLVRPSLGSPATPNHSAGEGVEALAADHVEVRGFADTNVKPVVKREAGPWCNRKGQSCW